MSNSEWRPKVGERVAIYGTIEQDDQSTLPFKVRFDGFEGDNDYTWAKISEVAPLPAAPEPRKPWEVLREAANLIAVKSNHLDGGGTFEFLEAEADRLEAAAAPKLPTLIETVRAYLDAPGDIVRQGDMAAALARAENGA